MQDEIIIKQSAKGNFLYTILSIGMSIGCLFMCFVDLEGYGTGSLRLLTGNAFGLIFLKIIMLIGFLFMALCTCFLIKRAFKKKDILIVNSQGITDNSSMFSAGFIPWSDVEKVFVADIMGEKLIEVALKDEQSHFNKQSKFLQKTLLYNKSIGHEMVCITLNSTGIKPESIIEEIECIFSKYKTK
ncbi:MAG: STM3941 family protein [Clostridia bacterium]